MGLIKKLFQKKVNTKHDVEKQYNVNDFYVVRYGVWSSTYKDGIDHYSFSTQGFRVAKLLTGKEKEKYASKSDVYGNNKYYFKLIKGGLVVPFIACDTRDEIVNMLVVETVKPMTAYLNHFANQTLSLQQLHDIDDIIDAKMTKRVTSENNF